MKRSVAAVAFLASTGGLLAPLMAYASQPAVVAAPEKTAVVQASPTPEPVENDVVEEEKPVGPVDLRPAAVARAQHGVLPSPERGTQSACLPSAGPVCFVVPLSYNVETHRSRYSADAVARDGHAPGAWHETTDVSTSMAGVFTMEATSSPLGWDSVRVSEGTVVRSKATYAVDASANPLYAMTFVGKSGEAWQVETLMTTSNFPEGTELGDKSGKQVDEIMVGVEVSQVIIRSVMPATSREEAMEIAGKGDHNLAFTLLTTAYNGR